MSGIAIAKLIEAAVVVLCIILIARRYSGTNIKVVAGDMLLWCIAVFFIMPLAVHVVTSTTYTIYPALQPGHDDAVVRVWSAIGVLIAVAVTLLAIAKAQRIERDRESSPPLRVRRRLWLAASFLPLAVVVVSPDPGAYLTFAAAFVLRGPGEVFADPESSNAQFHILMTWATYISTIAVAVWFAGRKSPWAWVVLSVVGCMDFWLNGKRHIVAIFFLVVVFVVVSDRSYTQRQFRRGLAGMAVALAGVFAVSAWYQTEYRPHLAANNQRAEAFLIDFGRLDVLRLALAGHRDLYVERPLEYPGQSLALHVQALLPGVDTVNYVDRVTSVARFREIGQTSGTITTSQMSEAVDNVGPAGLLIAPMVLAGITLLATYRNEPLLRLAGALTASMLVVMHVLAILPVAFLLSARLLQLFCRDAAVRSSIQRNARLSRHYETRNSATHTESAPRPLRP